MNYESESSALMLHPCTTWKRLWMGTYRKEPDADGKCDPPVAVPLLLTFDPTPTNCCQFH